MIAIKHFRECIIRPALDQLKLYSLAAEELLVVTAAQESLGGTYLMQSDALGYPRGPALGVYQMEPTTHYDLWVNFLKFNTLMAERLGLVISPHAAGRMVYDLHYATMIARLNYYRVKESLPEAIDIDGLVRYYKKYWNTEKGAATLSETKKNYERFCKSA